MEYVEVVIDLTGYQAEVIRLIAERSGKTVDEIVSGFFLSTRCNAPEVM